MTILRRLDCVLEPSKDEVLFKAAKTKSPEHLDMLIRRQFGLNFYNTSTFTLRKLLDDPESLAPNLIEYLGAFSTTVADIFERFRFENQIATMAEKDRLYLVVQKFSDIDLHPDRISNAEMGDLFEELIRKFADASNETAGEHFTPRDAIGLMVDLLFAEDGQALTEKGVVRTVYDPTAGTGGMLSVADDHLRKRNPDARLVMHGQEINDESYAICKADMIAKGQDPQSVKLGDTLANDLFAGRTFDYCMSNPPYGVDWKASEKKVRAEYAATGENGRFPGGLPSVGDGQMLFLSHLATKMRSPKDGGGRAGIVLNGSPLFSGAAESGESNIRKWLLQADLVEAIVALPTNMFYNTGIATYIWILDNTKQPERLGKVQLIDATSFFTKMRKNLGNKSREITEADVAKIVAIYDEYADGEHSKIMANEEFGYRKITVERPLRLNFSASPDRLASEAAVKLLAKNQSGGDVNLIRERLERIGDEVYTDRAQFDLALTEALDEGPEVIRHTPAFRKAIALALSERDENAEVCQDAKGNDEPNVSLRDTENVPLTEDIQTYFDREVKPHVPDAWIDPAKTKVGYEIPFTRIFYRYVPPRSLDKIDTDLNALVGEIMGLLAEVEA